MCQYEKCTGSYGEAYRGSESVSFDVAILCPKCATRVEASNHIHFGGEQWEPFLKCPSCEWGTFLYVKPKTAFSSRKEPAAVEPESPKEETPPAPEPAASWEERRIWWQEEVDRQVAAAVGWEALEYWKGVCIRDLPTERKRAIAAGIEHAIEEARQR